MSSPGLSSLEHCRSILLRTVTGLTDEQLDYLIFPDSKSIGELLMHVAGFEFLIVAGAQLTRGIEPDHALWSSLKPGFAREAEFARPQGQNVEFYLQSLAQVREIALAYFGPHDDRRLTNKANFPIAALTSSLCSHDADGTASQYEKLAGGVGTTFQDDGSENSRGETDLVDLLNLHETYHRGHITFQKYVFSRLKDGRHSVL